MVASVSSSSSTTALLLIKQQIESDTGNKNDGSQGKIATSGKSSNSQVYNADSLSGGVLSLLLVNQQSSTSTNTSATSESQLPYQQGSFQTAFQNLTQGLQSGDLSTAQQAFSDIAQFNSGTNGVSFDSIGVPKPIQQLLSNVGNSLQSGDLSGAQQTFSSSLSAAQPYQQGSFQTAFQNLIQGLQSGDLSTAQQAFSNIAQLDSGTNGVSFDSIGVPKPIQQLLSNVGNSLQSGDLAGAQQTFSSSLSAAQPYQQGSFQTAFQNLTQGLQSGDLSTAQQAFSDIAQFNSGTNGVNFDSIGVPQSVQQLLSNVGSSLQSGDLSGAQQALTTQITRITA